MSNGDQGLRRHWREASSDQDREAETSFLVGLVRSGESLGPLQIQRLLELEREVGLRYLGSLVSKGFLSQEGLAALLFLFSEEPGAERRVPSWGVGYEAQIRLAWECSARLWPASALGSGKPLPDVLSSWDHWQAASHFQLTQLQGVSDKLSIQLRDFASADPLADRLLVASLATLSSASVARQVGDSVFLRACRSSPEDVVSSHMSRIREELAEGPLSPALRSLLQLALLSAELHQGQ